jgi:hypothetical protein
MPLEALAAAGLASSIVQFIDFAAKLVSKGNKIHKSVSGVLPENEDLDNISNRLRILAYDLHQSCSRLKDSPLQSMSLVCIQASEELIAKLSSLKNRGGVSRFRSYRHALKCVWNKHEIDAMSIRLNLFRAELTTFLLISLGYF